MTDIVMAPAEGPSQDMQPVKTRLESREVWQADVIKRTIGSAAVSNLVEPLGLHNSADVNGVYSILGELIGDNKDDGYREEMQAHVDDIIVSTSNLSEEELGDLDFDGPEAIKIKKAVLGDEIIKDFTKEIDQQELSAAHKELLEKWPAFAETYIQGVHKGVVAGYIPKAAEARLDATINKTKVGVVHPMIMDSMIHGHEWMHDAPPTFGSYSGDSDEVLIRSDIVDHGVTLDDILAHELSHKKSGGTFEDSKTEPGKILRNRIGFSNYMANGNFPQSGLTEAVDQHITAGILTGDFETFDPDERRDKFNVMYYAVRKITADAIKKSGGIFKVKTLTNASFEDTGPDGGTTARKELVRELVSAFGHGAPRKLEKLYRESSNLDHNVPRDELRKRIEIELLGRIHAAEVDEHGTVTKAGSIDTRGLPELSPAPSK